MNSIAPVVQTDEEQEECQQTIRRFTQTDEGEWVVKKEHAESFQRGMIAHSLMSRAERFLGMAGGSAVHITFHLPYYSPGQSLDSDLAEKACVSAAKACAIYPLPIYFFDFGCILHQIGKTDEAQIAFAHFLSGLEKCKLDPMVQIWDANRDIPSSAQIAREILGK